MGTWTVPLAKAFKLVETPDSSVQFTDGQRVIYVSTWDIRGRDRPSPTAADLHATTRKSALQGRALTEHELNGPERYGHVQLGEEDSSIHLITSREADGSVLTCTFTFSDRSDIEWALSVWRQIRHG